MSPVDIIPAHPGVDVLLPDRLQLRRREVPGRGVAVQVGPRLERRIAQVGSDSTPTSDAAQAAGDRGGGRRGGRRRGRDGAAADLPGDPGAQVLMGAASAIFAPAIAAVSLGLVGHARMSRRTGRNEAFNHAGNVGAAVLAGADRRPHRLRGDLLPAGRDVRRHDRRDPVHPPREIDHDLARGAAGAEEPEGTGRLRAELDPTGSDRGRASPGWASCSATGGSWSSRRRWSCSTSPTRPCSRWSARS